MLICTANDMEAYGYSRVNIISTKGEYVFLGGWACIKMINGLPFRMKNVKEGVDVRVIASSPEGDLWGWEGSWWNISYSAEELPPDSYLMRYDGNEWTKYAYPILPWGFGVDVFFPANETVAVVCDTVRQIILYLFDGNGFRELSRSPVKYNGSEPRVHVSGDKITFEGQTYYSYSVTQNEWIQYDSWISMPNNEICWKNKCYSATTQPYTIATPEGKTLTLRPREFFGEPTFDAQGNIYIQSYGEGYESQIWTDRNGEWESIVRYNGIFICIGVSDNTEHTIWGADGGSYLAFLRDGKWMEVALLPPLRNADDPYTNMDPMRERYGNNGMNLAVINDTDGYVNVRTRPSISAPVIAMVLKDVTFMYESIPGNPSWVKVLLPSGTKGYLSNNRLKHLKEEPLIIYGNGDEDE